ncbi:hypothetical protein [Deinococcus enclensis]|uniref:MFS transporter n=1 Tax=Deinococcus enclensis TaxID=1049582 RepID=A0ABT9MAR7_9DEIO|nr:hypothetical protein [Deinococcus enclensis]MDP9763684.1 hypothetical protein [Deinococcus enclensis]
MEVEEREAHRAARRARRAARRRKDVPGLLFGLMIPVLVAALIFDRGEPVPGMMTLALAGFTAFLLWNPRTGTNLRNVLGNNEAQGVASMIVPAMFLSGIFGGPTMMVMVLMLAAAGLFLAGTQGSRLLTPDVFPPAPAPSPQPEEIQVPAAAPALPATASGEVVTPIDIRELCRGLPPALAGEVLATVEHLEAVEVQATRSGDARLGFDARQGLRDYLPNTVKAWKQQTPEQRDPQELARALDQVRRIAGADRQSSEHARQAWETQKRFLEDRTGKNPLELE